MKKAIILLNLLAAALVFPAIWGSSLLVGLRLKSNYTELDRAQVIDQKKLGEFDDQRNLDLQPNDRHKVPMWMLEPVIYYILVGIPCTLAFLLNALLLGIFWKQKTKMVQDSAEQEGSSLPSRSRAGS